MSFSILGPKPELPDPSAASLPTVVLVPGAFTYPCTYNLLLPLLQKHGIDAYALPLQSVGRRPPPIPGMYDDAAFIASQVEKLADRGKRVVLVGHSYGGVPVTQCTKGLTIEERRRAGKQGGIVRLVYLAAIVPLLGDAAKEREFEYRRKTREEEEAYETLNIEGMLPYAMNDVDLETARQYSMMSGQMSNTAMTDTLTWAGYKDVPSTYIKTLRDVPFPAERQKQCIEVLKEHAPGGDVEVVEIDAGHAAHVSKPDELVQILKAIAEKA